MNAEQKRLVEVRRGKADWRLWGPYLSERQWGVVREDYSESGDAWNFFPHDHARSRAYRHGEDGLAGISDEGQALCFALALWNGRDPILKERLFGLANEEGNHGEDVKEYYFYLDATPAHSYLKYLYKYPQAAYPYDDLVRTNAARSRNEPEYELLDTGVFAGDRYFDVFVEYAKAGPDDVLIRITVCNRGPEAARLRLLPTLWFRNTWSWSGGGPKPEARPLAGEGGRAILALPGDSGAGAALPDYALRCEGMPELLFTENETNTERLFGTPNVSPYVKDGFDAFVVHGNARAVNPERTGTKAGALYDLEVAGGGEAVVRLRLSALGRRMDKNVFGKSFEATFARRIQEADAFYATVIPETVSPDEILVMRQALAGMIWTKQYYQFDVDGWLRDHGAHPLSGKERFCRNREWFHMHNDHIISMPDKWEYPWYASWDLAFHALALSLVDIDFAKEQLSLMLQADYLHPSGQIPAYEWNFSDVNPPVHAWATLFLYRTEQSVSGRGDLDFLKRSFAKLMLNFTWWVNRKDRFGKNVFDGGFLGLDNIGVFDRSKGLPRGGYLEQADGTAWMALFCQNMIEMGMELACHDPSYDELLYKFLEHFLWIASGMNRPGDEGMWDEEDGFYYDLLRLPDGRSMRLKVRSMVGLLPLCAVTIIEKRQRNRAFHVMDILGRRLRRMPELRDSMHPIGPDHGGVAGRDMLALVSGERLRRILARMLDEKEFLSPYGIRALSRHHLEHPYVVRVQDQEHRVGYVPGDSDSGMFGGNSNWRGPVWMPVNQLIIRALLQYYRYYGDGFQIECPTGSGVMMNLFEVSREIASRLTRIFLRDESGRRPVFGDSAMFQEDPYWRDNILFYEFFHGDDGRGLGASHQTGWTGLVAKLIQLYGNVDAARVLESDGRVVFVKKG
ncbi:MGH1-like glycoside hydrolase domain-containing protein [Desulfolutivibrio sulfoxidireducens]|uniref:MGH1-like glycoside hydrolase domain-containing protein n=1 Tax=Desulfolutivibrio sulfoxidireducens TaxID=2773299 RepID=UPI00159EAE7E|nr:glucosidase [Desulfolutivibrio sulfoxidireducens]QLA16829.1 glucosidase [Desulfolutivibrio sulfoxidireducens]